MQSNLAIAEDSLRISAYLEPVDAPAATHPSEPGHLRAPDERNAAPSSSFGIALCGDVEAHHSLLADDIGRERLDERHCCKSVGTEQGHKRFVGYER